MLVKFVKIEDSISGCVREKFVTCKPIDVVSAAIQWEGLDMLNVYLMEQVDRLTRKLQKDDLTEEEIEGFKKQIERLEDQIEKNQESMTFLAPKWEYTVETIAAGEKEYTDDKGNICHIRNDKNAVRNVLRLTACQDNSKLYKYVVVNSYINEVLYESMQKIHGIDNREIDENGKLTGSEEWLDGEYYISAIEIGKLAKSLFSIPVETELTKKVNVKFNKTDISYVHALYIRGISVYFNTTKSKGTVYKGRRLNTLITCNKTKTGEKVYNFTGFYETLSKLAVEYLMK